MTTGLQGTGPGDLQALAQEYLDACVTALSDTPLGAPDRSFVSPGPPSWDCCPQLSVHVGGPVVADTLPLQPTLAPSHRVARGIEVNVVLLTATILRCDPTLDDEGSFPDAAELTATAAQTNADLWAIWQYVKAAKRENILWGPKEREFGFEPAIPQKQEGGCCGWEIPVRVMLPGYVTTLIS